MSSRQQQQLTVEQEMDAARERAIQSGFQPQNTRRSYSLPQAKWRVRRPLPPSRDSATPQSVLLERALPELTGVLRSNFQAQEQRARHQEQQAEQQGQQANARFDHLNARFDQLDARMDQLNANVAVLGRQLQAFLEGKVPVAIVIGPEAQRLMANPLPQVSPSFPLHSAQQLH
jgi:hypothetical protein